MVSAGATESVGGSVGTAATQVAARLELKEAHYQLQFPLGLKTSS